MFLDYWGLKKQPFLNVPDPDFLFRSPKHEEALMRLVYATKERKGAAMLTGEIGCGKTLISREFIKELSDQRYDLAVITNPTLSPSEFLRELLYQLGVESASSEKVELLHVLNDELLANVRKSKHTVILVDEAHLIIDRPKILEELRLLLNFQLNDQFLLTLILIGQPDLEYGIRKTPALEQRIAIRYFLGPLNMAECSGYISHRLKIAGVTRDLFTVDACDMVHRYSNGIPRRINNICDLSLLTGFLTGADAVNTEIIEKVIEASI